MDGDSLIGYLVRVKYDGEDGANIPLATRKSPYFIGRSADCQIRLKNLDVCERHCMIRKSQLKTVTVHSLDPNYPVLVNEKEVNSEGYSLQHGDIIKISDLSFRWEKIESHGNEAEEISKDAAHLSFISENVLKIGLGENRRSAPGCLLYEDGKKKDDIKEDTRLTNNFCGDAFLKDKEESEAAVTSRTNSDEEEFSDAITGEEMLTMNEDRCITTDAKIESPSTSKVACSVENDNSNVSRTRNGEATLKDDISEEDALFEDSSEDVFNENANLNEISINQNMKERIKEVSDIKLNIPRKDIPTLPVSDEAIQNVQDAVLRTPHPFEADKRAMPKSWSQNKLKNGYTPNSLNVHAEDNATFKSVDANVKKTSDLNLKEAKTIVIDNDQTIDKKDDLKPSGNDPIAEDAQNSIPKTPTCFEETYHSTPNGRSKIKLPKEGTPEPVDFPSESVAQNTPDIVESPAKLRGRRSTGIVPCVGTPSDVYRCKRSILTPAIRLSRSRDSTVKESEISSTKAVPRRRSSERKSTPLKAKISDRSIQRESILHSPIIEDEVLEKCEESQNESLNDPKFKFVQSRRRRRFEGSSFAIENRILEESETSQNNTTCETVNDLNEEEDEDKSLIAMSSCDDSEMPMSARIIINGDRSENDNEGEGALDSTFTIDTIETQKEDSATKEMPSLKSILTPLPKVLVSQKEKSLKKVTFARTVIAESFERSSWGNSNASDNYDSSLQQSSYNSANTTEISSNLCSKIDEGLDSFCKHEELLMSERSQSSVFSQNSTSTPVKASNSTSMSSEKLKSVTRFLDTWDKSFESSRISGNKNDQSSAASSLTGVSLEDNVDLTALQDAEKDQTENGISLNKTNEQSTNSTKEITDEFVTPASSKFVDTLNNTCENRESRSGAYSQNYTSTPVRGISSAYVSNDKDQINQETSENVVDLLTTPLQTLSKLDKTGNSKPSTPHPRKSKLSTGVTPQLKQLRLNKTVDSMGRTPCSVDMSDLKVNKNTASVANTSNVKVNKVVGSTGSTPYPRRSTKCTSYSKFKNARSATDSKVTYLNINTDSLKGTPCSKPASLNATAESGIELVNSNETINSLNGIVELPESPVKAISRKVEMSLETSELDNNEVLPENEPSTVMELSVTKNVVPKSEAVAEIEVIEEAETQLVTAKIVSQNLLDLEAIEEAATKDVFESVPIEEAATEDTIEEVATEDIIEEVATEDIIEEAATEDTIEEAATENTTEEAAMEDIIEEAAMEDIIEEAAMEDIIEEATSRMVEEAAVPGVSEAPCESFIEEAETQGVVKERLWRDVLEEDGIQDIFEDAETQYVVEEFAEQEIIEEAETQPVTEEIAEKTMLEEVVESCAPTPETLETEVHETVPQESRLETNEIVRHEVTEVTNAAFQSPATANAPPCEGEPVISSIRKSQLIIDLAVERVVDQPTFEHNEENVEVVDAAKSAVSSTDITIQGEEDGHQKGESELPTALTDEESKTTTRLSHPEIVLSRIESSNLRRSSRISRAEDSNCPSKGSAVCGMKATRSSTRKTSTKLESDPAKSASKRTRNDRDNQENEVRFSVFHRKCSYCALNPVLAESARKRIRNNEEITPAGKRRRTPLKRGEEKLIQTTPILQLPKVEIQKVDAETQTTARKIPLFQDKRSALRKLDDNSEVIQSPSKTAQSGVLGSLSPFSIVLPVLQSANDENSNVNQSILNATKNGNDTVLVKQKRVSKKRVAKPNTVARKTEKSSSLEVSKSTRKQKTSTGFLSLPDMSTKKGTNKRGAKQMSSTASSPASISSQVGSPKRAARKRRSADEEPTSDISPPKRTLRGRRVIPTIEEEYTVTADTKSKTATRGSKEKLEECDTEVKSKRGTRTKAAVEPTLKVAETGEPAELKRTVRSKRNANVLEENMKSENKRVTRDDRQKTRELIKNEPSTRNKKAAKSSQPVVKETEPETKKRSTRSKRAASPVESEKKCSTRTATKKEVEEIESKSSRKNPKGKSAALEVVVTDQTSADKMVKKSTRARAIRSEAAQESMIGGGSIRSKKSDRGPSVTVSRMSLRMKVVKKRGSSAEADSLAGNNEPQKKRVKICESVENQKSSARGKGKSSMKIIISKSATKVTKKTKSDTAKSTVMKSCLKRSTTATSTYVSPVTKSTRTTRSAKSEITTSTATSRRTRKK